MHPVLVPASRFKLVEQFGSGNTTLFPHVMYFSANMAPTGWFFFTYTSQPLFLCSLGGRRSRSIVDSSPRKITTITTLGLTRWGSAFGWRCLVSGNWIGLLHILHHSLHPSIFLEEEIGNLKNQVLAHMKACIYRHTIKAPYTTLLAFRSASSSSAAGFWGCLPIRRLAGGSGGLVSSSGFESQPVDFFLGSALLLAAVLGLRACSTSSGLALDIHWHALKEKTSYVRAFVKQSSKCESYLKEIPEHMF